ncbi:mechanosensitive ion channel [Chloroflexota bacterium]
MEQFLQQLSGTVGVTTWNLVVALVILIGGWLIALVIAAIVRSIFNRTNLNQRLSGWLGDGATTIDVGRWVGRVVFWLIFLLVLVAFFERLQLTAVTEPLNALLTQVFAFAPQLLGAALLFLIAWIIAVVVRFALNRLFKATQLDERLASQAGLEEAPGQVSLSETLANVIYWFIFLLFLPAILGALNMEGLLGPVQGMLDEVLAILPNILGAGLILLVGWFIARIVRQVVTGLLTAAGVDKFGERVGLSTTSGERTLSTVIGTIVYALILIPAIIAALNALQIAAISDPATEMLTALLTAVPAIFGAAVVLGIAYFVGRLVADLVANVLTGIGFNKVLTWLGLGGEPVEGQRTPSEVVGYLVLVVIMLFSAIEAANLLNFTIVADLLAQFINFVAQVAVAVVVFGLGLYFANLARTVILAAGGAQSNMLAQVARLAIIIFAVALALRQTGIADDIVNLTFGLLLGAIAVAVAIAFGIGGRDVAIRLVNKWSETVLESEHKTD